MQAGLQIMLALVHLIQVEGVGYMQIIRAEKEDVCRSCNLCLLPTTGRVTQGQLINRKKVARTIRRDERLAAFPTAIICRFDVFGYGYHLTYKTADHSFNTISHSAGSTSGFGGVFGGAGCLASSVNHQFSSASQPSPCGRGSCPWQ